MITLLLTKKDGANISIVLFPPEFITIDDSGESTEIKQGGKVVARVAEKASTIFDMLSEQKKFVNEIKDVVDSWQDDEMEDEQAMELIHSHLHSHMKEKGDGLP